MQRLLPVTQTPAGGRRRIAALVFTGLLNAALIYAVASGLAERVVVSLPAVLQAEVKPPPVQEAQPLPAPVATPEMAQPSMPQIPVPVVQIIRAPAEVSPSITAITVEKPVAQRPVHVPSQFAQPAEGTRAIGVAATHTSPAYPAMARRLGEQGRVELRIFVNTQGQVSDVQVAKSSGSYRLDEAAVEWVKKHWRYRPATKDGKPVESTERAAVIFNLANAR